MKIGYLDLDTQYEYLIIYKDKRNDTINTWTLSFAFGLNYRQMMKDDSVEILGVYKKLTDSQLQNIIAE